MRNSIFSNSSPKRSDVQIADIPWGLFAYLNGVEFLLFAQSHAVGIEKQLSETP